MIFPRLSALSEVLWTPKEKKSWPRFEKNIPQLFKHYDFWGTNYSRAYYDLKADLRPAATNKGVLLQLSTKDKTGRLSYGIAGKHFQKAYTTPVVLNQSGVVTAMYTAPNGAIDTVTFELKFNKATGKKISLKEPPALKYAGDGAFTLVNGIQNTRGLTRGREFIAYEGGDLEAIIDLGTVQPINSVVVHTLEQPGSWIYRPSLVEVFTAADGKNFTIQGTTDAFEETTNSNGTMTVRTNARARYVKVRVKNYGVIPDDKAGAGNRAWLFADEIEIH
jgi:hexosaminidase